MPVPQSGRGAGAVTEEGRGGKSAAEAGTVVAAAVKMAPRAGLPSATLGHSPGWGVPPAGAPALPKRGHCSLKVSVSHAFVSLRLRAVRGRENQVFEGEGKSRDMAAHLRRVGPVVCAPQIGSVSDSLSMGTGGGVRGSFDDLFGWPCPFPIFFPLCSSVHPLPGPWFQL